MKKLNLILVILLLSYSAYSQYIIMTKEKHELLRKDIENYKKLIIIHNKIKSENQILLDSIKTLKEKINHLNWEIEECNKKPILPKKKGFFKRLREKLIKVRRKTKFHKGKQDW